MVPRVYRCAMTDNSVPSFRFPHLIIDPFPHFRLWWPSLQLHVDFPYIQCSPDFPRQGEGSSLPMLSLPLPSLFFLAISSAFSKFILLLHPFQRDSFGFLLLNVFYSIHFATLFYLQFFRIPLQLAASFNSPKIHLPAYFWQLASAYFFPLTWHIITDPPL